MERNLLAPIKPLDDCGLNHCLDYDLRRDPEPEPPILAISKFLLHRNGEIITTKLWGVINVLRSNRELLQKVIYLNVPNKMRQETKSCGEFVHTNQQLQVWS